MIALKHILLPTDFSDTAAVALKYARALAETFNAALHVLENPLLGWKPPRRVGEEIVIDGDIRITVSAIQGEKVRIGANLL